MTSSALDMPELARRRVLALGAEGARWLEGLPELVAGLAGTWLLEPVRTLSGGTEALVVETRRADGSPAVLKIATPADEGFGGEMETLRLADGRGYARLLAADAARRAVLLERLGPNLHDLEPGLERQQEILCETLRAAWRPLPDPGTLPTGAAKARWHVDHITRHWDDANPPADPAVKARALDFARQREAAYRPAASVLAHGDAHPWNTLSCPDGSGYKFVDPDGLHAEPACDVAVSMREWNGPLLAGDTLALGLERCRRLHRLTGAGEEAIWQWGFVERVSTGLVCSSIDWHDEAAAQFTIAAAWLAA